MVNILEVDSVIKSFDNRLVLTDIYLKCQTGEVIGLLGRNGTGKSTLMKILFGSINAEGSFIKINGRVYGKPFKTSGLVAYLPQHSFLLKNLTVIKTANLFINRALIDAFFDDDIIGKLKNNKVGALSGGELRYLEIKLLLNSNNSFILLDEPFNGIAPVIVEKLKIMIRMQALTKGIILTDHDYNNVLDVATRFCLLYDGGIKYVSTRQDLVAYNYLLNAN